jgi:hypothetical protein
MRILVAGFALILGIFFVVGTNGAQDKKDPKYPIKEVMKEAMKGGLCAKVAKGEASDAEKAQLVEYFTSLTMCTPPKGEADAWKTRTGELLKAAKDGDVAALKKASNCMSCHTMFKK